MTVVKPNHFLARVVHTPRNTPLHRDGIDWKDTGPRDPFVHRLEEQGITRDHPNPKIAAFRHGADRWASRRGRTALLDAYNDLHPNARLAVQIASAQALLQMAGPMPPIKKMLVGVLPEKDDPIARGVEQMFGRSVFGDRRDDYHPLFTQRALILAKEREAKQKKVPESLNKLFKRGMQWALQGDLNGMSQALSDAALGFKNKDLWAHATLTFWLEGRLGVPGSVDVLRWSAELFEKMIEDETLWENKTRKHDHFISVGEQDVGWGVVIWREAIEASLHILAQTRLGFGLEESRIRLAVVGAQGLLARQYRQHLLLKSVEERKVASHYHGLDAAANQLLLDGYEPDEHVPLSHAATRVLQTERANLETLWIFVRQSLIQDGILPNNGG